MSINGLFLTSKIEALFVNGDSEFWRDVPRPEVDMRKYGGNPKGYFGTTEDLTDSGKFGLKTILRDHIYHTIIFATDRTRVPRIDDKSFPFLGPLISMIPEADFKRAMQNHEGALAYLNRFRC